MTIKKQIKISDDKESKKEKDAHISRKIRYTILKKVDRFDQRAIFDPEEEGVL